jgi:hypothetical protein
MMKTVTVNPNLDLYVQLQRASDHFNQMLFDGSLPEPILTVQRAQGAAGYFSSNRWAHVDGRQVHEIALNPVYFANSSLLQVFQTIAHEQCHLWQHTYGRPSRPGYHNVEWAAKMTEIGLTPSSTGKPGGSKTGQKMSDYPAARGRFVATCVELLESGFVFPLVDQGFDAGTTMRMPSALNLQINKKIETQLSTPIRQYFGELQSTFDDESTARKRKLKYCCRFCKVNAWGKPELDIRCGQCGRKFVPAA